MREHPRRYTDPGALNGWDSYRSRWFVGRSLQTLIEYCKAWAGKPPTRWIQQTFSEPSQPPQGAKGVMH